MRRRQKPGFGGVLSAQLLLNPTYVGLCEGWQRLFLVINSQIVATHLAVDQPVSVRERRRSISLPTSDAPFEHLADLKTNLQRRLPYVSLTSEAARREVLIAPIVLALIDATQAQLRIEYSINVSNQLKGALDYYLHAQRHLLVIEAKNADLARGFTQLAVELIALSQWTNSAAPLLYGAVSTGDIWQFGVLHHELKQIEQDLNLYRVPADLDPLFRSLVAILTNPGSGK